MQALVYEAPEVMVLRDVADPSVAPHEVLIEIAYSGICGSELSGYLGKNSLRQPPLVFGHELSGWVRQAGADVSPEHELRPGEMVTVNPLLVCGSCRYCITGREQLCPRRTLLGAHVAGSNAEFVSVPATSVLRLPEGVTLENAAMVEPAACAIRAAELGEVRPTDRALVIGAGPIGMFILQVLAEFGVRKRYVAELNPTRLARAASLGAVPVTAGDQGQVTELHNLHGADVAFDAVGIEETRRACLVATVPGGRVLLVGLHSDETTLPLNSLIRSEVSIRGCFAYSRTNFRTALTWLAEQRIGLRDGVVVAPLGDGDKWYRRLVSGDAATKVLLRPGDDGTPT